jgi:hypothetical protein
VAKRKKRKETQILRDKADALWSYAVREDWGHRCAICGASNLQAHHLVGRGNQATRYSLRNGIALCEGCHKFGKKQYNRASPHIGDNDAWNDWLQANHPELAEYRREHKHDRFNSTTNKDYYHEVILALKQFVPEADFERIVGVRLARWLEENE